MGTEYHRQLITQMIQRLKRDKRGFGERPCSFYAHEGPEPFLTHVLGLRPVQHLLPYQETGELQDCLTQQQQQTLKETVDRVDRYGSLVMAWKRGDPVPRPCLVDLERRLRFWALRHVPDCLWAQLEVPQLTDALMAGLQDRITSYSYTEDLMLWALPHLVRTLWMQMETSGVPARSGLATAELRTRLLSTAQAILDQIQETYGIHGMKADEVTERALLLVMHASEEEYDANRDEIWKWALGKLKRQIKLQIPYYAEPNMGADWYDDPREEAWEMQKRRALLLTFYDVG